MSGKKRPTKKKPAIERLMDAMDACARARGEANWTNGYRAAKGEPAESDLYDKELRQWKAYGGEEKRFRRLALQLLREAKREGVSEMRRSVRDA